MFEIYKKVVDWNGSQLTLEYGKIARQADASVVVTCGKTTVLCSVVAAKTPAKGIDFLPLTVSYTEKFYAIGKVPGGFNKRESRPTKRETLIARLIDRPLRPLFSAGFYNEVNITCIVLSYDKQNEPEILALIGAAAAIEISGIPFNEPIAAARVGYTNGEFILNPTTQQLKTSELELVVAGSESSVLMVESEAKELSEEVMLEAVMFGHRSFQPVIRAIKELSAQINKPKVEFKATDNSQLEKDIKKIAQKALIEIYKKTQKKIRRDEIVLLKEKVMTTLAEHPSFDENKINSLFKNLEKDIVRGKTLKNKVRIDGRSCDEIRQIACELDLLGSAHGSALFTRGETQALCVTTLGTEIDEQMVDNIHGLSHERFMLHYNFPPFSVGEVGMMKPPGRREIGHGELATRALNPILPNKEQFPYSIRVVSEIMESNGSSSMATVCGGSLAMMAAGVPIKSPVAGIAMGLIKEQDEFIVLSDILGDEDSLGDMDFKVAGTDLGVTALQMDIKINGINEQIMRIALTQARSGIIHILSKMNEVIESARTELNENAPRITTLKIDKEKIRDVIGSGGKVIKDICEKSGAKIDIADDGTIKIASSSEDGTNIAINMIKGLTTHAIVGEYYEGVITKIIDFGAIVAFSGKEGLLHISELCGKRVEKVTDVVQNGQAVRVKVIAVDSRTGKVRLSMKESNTSNSDLKSADNKPKDVKPDDATDTSDSRTTKPRRHERKEKPRDNPRNQETREDFKEIDGPENAKKKRRFF